MIQAISDERFSLREQEVRAPLPMNLEKKKATILELPW